MATMLQVRDAIVTLVHNDLTATYPTLPVFWENTLEVDLDALTEDRFLRIEVEFSGANQLTIDAPVQRKTWGLIYCTLLAREGSGVRDTLAILDHLSTTLAYQYLLSNKLFLGTPTPGPRRAKDGWRSYELSVPFEFDSFT